MQYSNDHLGYSIRRWNMIDSLRENARYALDQPNLRTYECRNCGVRFVVERTTPRSLPCNNCGCPQKREIGT